MVAVPGTADSETLRGTSGDDTLTGGKGNDKLYGGSGSDLYRYGKGDGVDTIIEYGWSNDSDTLTISGYTASQTQFTRVGNTLDLLIRFAGSSTDYITVKDGLDSNSYALEQVTFSSGGSKSLAAIRTEALKRQSTTGSDTIVGYYYFSNVIASGDGNDTVTGGYYSDTLAGGKGKDSLVGGYGSDTYVYAKGDGLDSIRESGSYSDTDTLKISGYKSSEARFSRVGNSLDLVISFAGSSTDRISIADGLGSAAYAVDNVVFSAGGTKSLNAIRTEALSRQTTTGSDVINGYTFIENTLVGGAGDDTLTGGYYDDTLKGGTGRDKLYGGEGEDTYLYAKGDGLDTIEDNGWSSEDDTLQISGYKLSQARFTRLGTNSFVIHFTGSSTDSITVTDGLGVYGDTLETVLFTLGGSRSTDEIRDEVLRNQATSSNDTIVGFTFRANALFGGAGKDTLIGSSYDDSLDGGTGADTLRGGNGDDTYAYAKGGGADTVEDDGWSDSDTISISGYSPGQTSFTRIGNTLDYRISFTGSSTDSITVTGGLGNGSDAIELIEFADGSARTVDEIRDSVLARQSTSGSDSIVGYSFRDNDIASGAGNDTISGGYGSDTLAGGKGDDTIYGSYGEDSYSYRKGDGSDTIYDSGYSSDADTLTISGYKMSETIFSRSANNYDLVISFRGSASDKITIKDGLRYYSSQLENVVFSAGGNKTIDEIEQIVDTPRLAVVGKQSSPGAKIAASTLFTVENNGGSTITSYQFKDSTAAASSGSFKVGGVTQAANKIIEVMASALSSVQFVVGAAGSADQLQVRALNATNWSEWSSVKVSTSGALIA